MNRRSPRMRAQRRYRLLVRLYPPAHRRAFGEQMVQTFGDHYRDAVERRGGSTPRFWLAVLADTATSLRTEHAAELRTRGRRVAAATRRRRGHRNSLRTTRGRTGGTTRGLNRPTRVRRRLRYRRVRILLRTGRLQLVYRGRLAILVVILLLAGAVLGTGTAMAHPVASLLAAGLIVAAWLGYRLRLVRPVMAGPPGNGPAPPGGAAMREPRRPLPMSPAGSAARPRPDHDSPGRAAALI